jgi:CO/xanthine dehydrogenase FAD-binding subunit
MEGLPAFEYHRPSSVEEAVGLLARYGEDAKPMAGGTDLLVQMKNRWTSPRHLIALKWIPRLDGITDGEMVRIGALATHSRIKESPVIRGRFPILIDALSQLGSQQVRNVATIGGNLCNAAPSADTAPALLTLGAKVVLVGPKGKRDMGLENFFLGPGKTALNTDEILESILLPRPPPYSCGAYMKHMRRAALDLPIIGVATQCTFSRDLKIIEDIRAPTPIRVKAAEAYLRGKPLEEGILNQGATLASQEAKPRDTWRGSAFYRSEMIRVLVQEAILLSRDRAMRLQVNASCPEGARSKDDNGF